MQLQRLIYPIHRSLGSLQNSPRDLGNDKAPRHTPPLSRVKVSSDGHQSTHVPPVRIACVLGRPPLLMMS